MSTVYVLEPPTKGKVVVKTTHGPVDIELWPKEAPKAVRNFVQLCMEGYYDNNIFHRVIKSFLIQTGDPTSTGEGGESIYGGAFPDEFHSRLRFKHRGLVACAGSGSPNSNGSQFFITLDRCDWLDKKHTIFGKVTGDSIYNLLQLGEVETDKDDRPLDPPPKILSVEVLWNPFDDIVPRVNPLSLHVETDKKIVKEKATKKLNLLSFGEEAEEEEKELADVKIKIKSSHDVLDDPRLLKEESRKNDMELAEAKTRRDAVRDALSSKKEEMRRESEVKLPEDYSDDDEASFDVRMRQQILKKRMDLGDAPPKQKSRNDRARPDDRARPNDRAASPPRSNSEKHDDKPKKDKLSLKKKGIGSEARAVRMVNADGDLQLLGEADRERQLQKQKRRRRQGHEDEVLERLEKFKAIIGGKGDAPNGEKAAAKDEDLSDWTAVKLQFATERGKDNMSRSNDPNDYVVHDPLLEKGKEKFNKMQAKQKRREREWAGHSLT